MPETLVRTAVQLALPNTIPGPAGDTNDRGECQELDTDTMTRCTGRRIASREYREGEGFLVKWRCDSCGYEVVP